MPIGAATAALTHQLIAAAGEWDPASLGTVVLDLDSRVGLTIGTGGVSTWADQSGAGNNATQASTGLRPDLITDGWATGIDAINFDSAELESLDCPLATAAGQTYAIVGRRGATAPANNSEAAFASGTLFQGNGTGVEIRHKTDGVMDFRYSDGTNRPTTSGRLVGTNTKFICVARQAGANNQIAQRMRVGATLFGIQTAGGTQGAPGSNTFRIGESANNNNWLGDLARVIVWSSALSDTDIGTILTELNDIYAVG